jgi:hypothetical protein
MFGSLGDRPERFSSDTWITRDVCSRDPFPFDDKEIDYVFCSHTLEDLRDPIFVCSEIVRVGKRGYIEVPSWLAECSLGIESSSYAGWYHHRWIVEIQGDELTFTHKPHNLHSEWNLHAPRRVGRSLKTDELGAYLFWNGGFSYRENIQIRRSDLEKEIEGHIRNANVHRLRFKMRDEGRRIRNALSEFRARSEIKSILGRL